MIPVEGHKSLFRDQDTNAILNTDDIAYENYISTKEIIQINRQKWIL